MDQGVGHEIKRLREERGWSQAKLAVEAEMSVSGVSMIETGQRNLTTTTLAKLARAFGLEIADLFPKAPGPVLQLELEEQRGADEERRLINAVAPAVIAAQMSWEAYLEGLPEQPTPEVLEEESNRIDDLLTDVCKINDALKKQGVLEAMDPYVAAIEAGESIPQPLRRNIIGLHNAMWAAFTYTVPKARNWASRFEELAQSENIDSVAQEWSAKDRILETDTAQTDA